jgi:hypothetical protein
MPVERAAPGLGRRSGRMAIRRKRMPPAASPAPPARRNGHSRRLGCYGKVT